MSSDEGRKYNGMKILVLFGVIVVEANLANLARSLMCRARVAGNQIQWEQNVFKTDIICISL